MDQNVAAHTAVVQDCAPTEQSLPSDLIGSIFGKLGPNYIAVKGRLVSRDLAATFSQQQHLTARLSIPLPQEAGDSAWRPFQKTAVRALSLDGKLRMLSSAAASGTEGNLELAWALLSPTLHPELLMETGRPFYLRDQAGEDAGSVAIRKGHMHLLPWLVEHRCHVDPSRSLVAAAEHCDLEGLQALWKLLGDSFGPPATGKLPLRALAKAAGGSAKEATAKVSWLLSKSGARQQLLMAAAAGAASAGSQPVLEWLQEQGLDLRGAGQGWQAHVLTAALQAGHVAVAEWLVDVAGCSLPQPADGDGGWRADEEEHAQQPQRCTLREVWRGAARGGGAEAVGWLLRRGAPMHRGAIVAAAAAGQLELLQALNGVYKLELSTNVFAAAAGSGSTATLEWLVQAGCPMDWTAYLAAAEAGNVDTVRWLKQQAGCPIKGFALYRIFDAITESPLGSNLHCDLVELVRALVEVGYEPHCGDGVIQTAAELGHFPLMRYWYEELQLDRDWGQLGHAAGGGCEALVEWMVEAGMHAQWELDDEDPYALAACNGDMAMLACLRRLNIPVAVYGYPYEVIRMPPPTIRWLVENGAVWDPRTMEVVVTEAKTHGNGKYADSVAWLEARLALRPLGEDSSGAWAMGEGMSWEREERWESVKEGETREDSSGEEKGQGEKAEVSSGWGSSWEEEGEQKAEGSSGWGTSWEDEGEQKAEGSSGWGSSWDGEGEQGKEPEDGSSLGHHGVGDG